MKKDLFPLISPIGASAVPPPVPIRPGERNHSLATLALVVTDDGIWPREKGALTITALPSDEVGRLSIRLTNLHHFAFTVWQDRQISANHYPISNFCTHGAHFLGPSLTAIVNPQRPAF